MKIRKRALEKYARFLSLTRDDEPRPLSKEPMVKYGVRALEAFHLFESCGTRVATCEPLLLERYKQGKEWHGVTVAMVAESFAVDRLITSKEIKTDYPEWVAKEIFSAAERIANNRFGYVPTFVRNHRDYSEAKITPTGEIVWE